MVFLKKLSRPSYSLLHCKCCCFCWFLVGLLKAQQKRYSFSTAFPMLNLSALHYRRFAPSRVHYRAISRLNIKKNFLVVKSHTEIQYISFWLANCLYYLVCALLIPLYPHPDSIITEAHVYSNLICPLSNWFKNRVKTLSCGLSVRSCLYHWSRINLVPTKEKLGPPFMIFIVLKFPGDSSESIRNHNTCATHILQAQMLLLKGSYHMIFSMYGIGHTT